MRIPQRPPNLSDLLAEAKQKDRMMQLFSLMRDMKMQNRHYLHWDALRRYTPPEGVNHREWWMVQKISRIDALKEIPLKDTEFRPFQFAITEMVMEELHQIDLGSGGMVSLPEPITHPQTRDRYLVRSLIEEAITSSQLEGAVTTREVAKEMIRSGRPARDNSEQMILNNYATMQCIRELKESALSPDLVFQIHRMVTDKTLEDPTAAGRFRHPNEKCVVGDDFGEVYHNPPNGVELADRMAAMCDLANGVTPAYFVHPAVRAIILHFWLAYDHPFLDGNGRTARALFYWAMLHSGYWLFEFISISNILRKATVKYSRSFLYTETDDNDLTYFIIAQTKVIRRAIRELHSYIERKTADLKNVESHMRALDLFNHRQVEVIRNALKHPGQRYTFASHQMSHNIVYQTARTDLLNLGERFVLEKRKKGKQIFFVAPSDLSARLLKLEKETGL